MFGSLRWSTGQRFWTSTLTTWGQFLGLVKIRTNFCILSSDLHTYTMCTPTMNTRYIKCKSSGLGKKNSQHLLKCRDIWSSAFPSSITEVLFQRKQERRAVLARSLWIPLRKQAPTNYPPCSKLHRQSVCVSEFLSESFIWRMVFLSSKYMVFCAALSTVNQIFSASELPWGTKGALWEAPIVLIPIRAPLQKVPRRCLGIKSIYGWKQ